VVRAISSTGDSIRGMADLRGHDQGVPGGNGDEAEACVHAADHFCCRRNRPCGGVVAGRSNGARVRQGVTQSLGSASDSQEVWGRTRIEWADS
jgi:hypothetical protein